MRRSKTPELVRQEFYGLFMAHFATWGLLHEAALEAGEAPDRYSSSLRLRLEPWMRLWHTVQFWYSVLVTS